MTWGFVLSLNLQLTFFIKLASQRAQVLMFAQQTVYLLSHLPSAELTL